MKLTKTQQKKACKLNEKVDFFREKMREESKRHRIKNDEIEEKMTLAWKKMQEYLNNIT